MQRITSQDLNDIREVISANQTTAAKLDFYSNSCNDPDIKQMFKQGSKDANNSVQNLLKML